MSHSTELIPLSGRTGVSANDDSREAEASRRTPSIQVEGSSIHEATSVSDLRSTQNGHAPDPGAPSHHIAEHGPAEPVANPPQTDHWTETNIYVQPRNLNFIDVSSLILNKMIGTGIFTTPATVLVLAGSKPLSLGLWFVGGVYTFLCLLIYIELGNAFPYNGGELIYLDRLYYILPRLLATCMYSGYFIFLANTAGNSIAFAKHVLVAYSADIDPDRHTAVVRLISVSILTVVCFLHFNWRNLGLFLNRLLTAFKICLLLAVSIAGFIAHAPDSGSHWNDHNGSTFGGAMSALVLIFYAYEGWENANYVAGEIPQLREGDSSNRKGVLRLGAFIAVFVVTLLYMLTTAALYTACEFIHDGRCSIDRGDDLAFVKEFSDVAFGHTTAIAVCIALSAAGNLIAVIYTYSKVKQAMALQNFLPFSSLLSIERDDATKVTTPPHLSHDQTLQNQLLLLRSRQDRPFRPGVPKGGIVVHWIVTTITICIIPNTADGYSFLLGIFSYAHTILAVFTAIGFVWIAKACRHSEKYKRENNRDKWKASFPFLQNWPTRLLFASLFAILNAVVIVGAPLQNQIDELSNDTKIERYWWPIIFFIAEAASILYWIGIWLLHKKSGSFLGLHLEIRQLNDWGDGKGKKGLWPDNKTMEMEEAKKDGSHRRVIVTVIPDSHLERTVDVVRKGGELIKEYLWK